MRHVDAGGVYLLHRRAVADFAQQSVGGGNRLRTALPAHKVYPAAVAIDGKLAANKTGLPLQPLADLRVRCGKASLLANFSLNPTISSASLMSILLIETGRRCSSHDCAAKPVRRVCTSAKQAR
ncbi:hypothetical protein [Aminobacter sp. MET-1]|uniref:hypothetical protein n=1 Tax=Aminobacter sp. MET-1 TaxID=2951085 RepID=UPI00226A058F|nr:hypothetical protein [Aminobacter sp. MET-1]MCX8567848.1 hypothetical protein [Aminobacter sp. MET-1]